MEEELCKILHHPKAWHPYHFTSGTSRLPDLPPHAEVSLWVSQGKKLFTQHCLWKGSCRWELTPIPASHQPTLGGAGSPAKQSCGSGWPSALAVHPATALQKAGDFAADITRWFL